VVTSRDYIFIHVQKTAGTFVQEYMCANIPHSYPHYPKHGGYGAIDQTHMNRKMFAVVRIQRLYVQSD